MTIAMARFDLEKEQAELDRRQQEYLKSLGYRVRADGKAYKFTPVPEGFFKGADGGRAESEERRKAEYAGDCVVRAWAIALYGPQPTGAQYKKVWRDFCRLIREWAFDGKSNAVKALYRNGTRHTKPDYMPHKDVINAYAAENGFVWTATSGIGVAETVHLRPDELPGGTLVLQLSKHYSCMIDGILYDRWDTSVSRHVEEDEGRGWRKVYGYYAAP